MNWPAAARRAAPTRRLVLRPEVVAAWCDDLARRVRSGDSLAAALREAATVDPALRISTDDMRLALERGAGVADAVSGRHPRSIEESFPGLQHLTLASSIIGVSATIGGSAAAPLDRVAAALRLRAVDRDDRATQASQARMSAHVLTVVPLLMLLVLTAADSDVRAAVVGGAGSLCVALGLLLNACGWWWMRRLVEVRQ
jgi:Flp pilus assembly protein TadB